MIYMYDLNLTKESSWRLFERFDFWDFFL